MEEQALVNRRVARLPKVKEYLEGKKEKYRRRDGSTDDDQKEECAICLGEFREDEDDYVVVLDCGSASKNFDENQAKLLESNK